MIDFVRRVFTPSENSLICMRDAQTGKTQRRALVPVADAGVDVLDFRHAGAVRPATNSATGWLPTFVSFALFLVMFHRVYYRDRTQVIWNALGIAVLGFVVTPFNPGAQGYLIYACAFLAFYGTPREAARSMIIVLVSVLGGMAVAGLRLDHSDQRDPGRLRGRLHEHQLRAQARARRAAAAQPRRNPPARRAWPSANASAATCTICSATRCR